GAFGVLASDGDFLDDDEVVGLGVLPVDQPGGFRLLTHARTDLHAVAQQPVDVAVGLVQVVASTDRGSSTKLIEGAIDEVVVVATSAQVLRKQFGLDVRVALAVLPVAEVFVAELIAKQRNHAVLSFPFNLSYITHR